jgi:hypothetical protein
MTTLSQRLGQTRQQPPPRRDESGVTLLLALVFLLAIGLNVVSIGSATSNNLLNSSNLNSQRSLEYAGDAATSIAVQNVRYSGNPYTATVTDCIPGGSPVPISGVNVWVSCSQLHYDPIAGTTRDINFFACTTKPPVTAQDPGGSKCFGNGIQSPGAPILRADVVFDDFAVDNTKFCTVGGVTSTCGSAMQIDSWIVQSAKS